MIKLPPTQSGLVRPHSKGKASHSDNRFGVISAGSSMKRLLGSVAFSDTKQDCRVAPEESGDTSPQSEMS
jgi:hypothetical protein